MSIDNIKAAITYVLSDNKGGTSTIDFSLQPISDGWVDIITQEASTQQKMHSASLSNYSPSLRNIAIDLNTTFSLYLKDHWYLLGGAICQIGWSSSQKRLELITICSSNLRLIEIDKLPWTLKEEQAEVAKKYAYDRLSAHYRRIHLYPSLEAGEIAYERIELAQSEEMNVDFLGAKMGRGFNRQVPERTWVMTFLCSSEGETQSLKRYVLVDYYRSRPHFACYHLSRRNGVFSVADAY